MSFNNYIWCTLYIWHIYILYYIYVYQFDDLQQFIFYFKPNPVRMHPPAKPSEEASDKPPQGAPPKNLLSEIFRKKLLRP